MTKNRRSTRQVKGQAVIGLAGFFLAILVPCSLADRSFVEETHTSELALQAVVSPMAEDRTPVGSHAPSATELEHAVVRAARQHHVHPALLLAVIKAESSFNPIVISKAGAVGLMQLIPETAMRHGVQNLYDTNENVAGGARHLRYLLDRFHGNTRLALAAYNAGERKVDRYKTIPPYKETRNYVQKVLSYYRDYRKEARLLPLGGAQHEGYKVRTL